MAVGPQAPRGRGAAAAVAASASVATAWADRCWQYSDGRELCARAARCFRRMWGAARLWDACTHLSRKISACVESGLWFICGLFIFGCEFRCTNCNHYTAVQGWRWGGYRVSNKYRGLANGRSRARVTRRTTMVTKTKEYSCTAVELRALAARSASTLLGFIFMRCRTAD